MSIIHVTSFFDSKDSLKRNELARSTWHDTYKMGGWTPCLVVDEQLPRLFDENGRKIPFISDIIDEAMKLDGDYICLTNGDTCFSESLHERCQKFVEEGAMIYGHRKDFPSSGMRRVKDKELTWAKSYPGLDFFLFPKSWWESIKPTWPDMLIGREAWDLVLKVLMDFGGAREEINLIYHYRHSSFWEANGNRRTVSGQVHNRKLACEFLRSHGFDPKPHGLL